MLGMLVTIEATILGFFIALVLGLDTGNPQGRSDPVRVVASDLS